MPGTPSRPLARRWTITFGCSFSRHGPQSLASDASVPAVADNYHLRGAAAVTQHTCGGTAGQHRPYHLRTEHRSGVLDARREDLLRLSLSKVVHRLLAEHGQVLRCPGKADRRRRPASPCLPDSPPQGLTGAWRPVISSDDPISRIHHEGLPSLVATTATLSPVYELCRRRDCADLEECPAHPFFGPLCRRPELALAACSSGDAMISRDGLSG